MHVPVDRRLATIEGIDRGSVDSQTSVSVVSNVPISDHI